MSFGFSHGPLSSGGSSGLINISKSKHGHFLQPLLFLPLPSVRAT